MSWIVERLFIERHNIRENFQLESETFMNLLTLEDKVLSLYSNGFISDLEMEILDGMGVGMNISEISRDLGIARSTTSNMFRNVCTRIAYNLGGYFTDDGFLEELEKKHNLGDSELEKVKEKIESKFRHNISGNRSDV